MLGGQSIIQEQHGTAGRFREMSRQRKVETSRPRDKAPSMQVEQSHVRIGTRGQDPLGGNLAHLGRLGDHPFDRQWPAGSHPPPKPLEIEPVGAERRVATELFEVSHPFGRDLCGNFARFASRWFLGGQPGEPRAPGQAGQHHAEQPERCEVVSPAKSATCRHEFTPFRRVAIGRGHSRQDRVTDCAATRSSHLENFRWLEFARLTVELWHNQEQP